jgi:hypothetical protein
MGEVCDHTPLTKETYDGIDPDLDMSRVRQESLIAARYPGLGRGYRIISYNSLKFFLNHFLDHAHWC